MGAKSYLYLNLILESYFQWPQVVLPDSFSLGLILKCFCITLAHSLDGQWDKVTLAHVSVSEERKLT